MRTLKLAAHDMRHAVRDKLFRNNQPMAVNLRYALYHAEARRHWKPRGIGSSDAALAKEFSENGYLALPPAAAFNGSDVAHQTDELFAKPANCHTLMDGAFRLIDGIERLPSVMNVFDAQLEHVLESYFQSHFKIFGVYFYRIVPTPTKPQSSFLWHLDNCPGPEIKLMVYLDDVTNDTGAFRLKKKALTDQLRSKGFRNRNQIQRVQADLENGATTEIIEGPPGTRILFENGKVLHKATSPLREHRDVVSFVILPSDIPWRVHFARHRHLVSTNAGACVDPWTDKPEQVGYD
ncbi:hypothetical protein ACFPFP_12690 [Bradyrhizobium sp. GCM10023182]|uniref:Phytanoyl-CoA dioxygenase n=1 Tax=Bradyrhizobium zhengyangense TaxID=2911009 RepID=A0ABS9LLC4_9BRAD|nr:hypothetical protein [Bradyrhizobium zhengyangense]MCG2667807.1 hypothetical protein [Bradyrhizobium zhengyangense]